MSKTLLPTVSRIFFEYGQLRPQTQRALLYGIEVFGKEKIKAENEQLLAMWQGNDTLERHICTMYGLLRLESEEPLPRVTYEAFRAFIDRDWKEYEHSGGAYAQAVKIMHQENPDLLDLLLRFLGNQKLEGMAEAFGLTYMILRRQAEVDQLERETKLS